MLPDAVSEAKEKVLSALTATTHTSASHCSLLARAQMREGFLPPSPLNCMAMVL